MTKVVTLFNWKSSAARRITLNQQITQKNENRKTATYVDLSKSVRSNAEANQASTANWQLSLVPAWALKKITQNDF